MDPLSRELMRDLIQALERNAAAAERQAATSQDAVNATRLKGAAAAAQTEWASGIRNGPATANFMQSFQSFRQEAFQNAGIAPSGGQRGGGGILQQGASLLSGRFAPLAMTYALFNTLRDSATAQGSGETYDVRDRIPIFGGYFKGKREFDSRVAVLAASSRLDRDTMGGYLRDLGTSPDPFYGGRSVGAEAARRLTESMLPYERSGVNLNAQSYMARRLIAEHGGAAAPEAAKNIAPFIEDPLTRDAMLREFSRKSHNDFNADVIDPMLRGIGRKGFGPAGSRLDNSFVVSGVLSHGLADTYGALSSILKDDPDKMAKLQDFALRFSDKMKTAGLRSDIAGSNVVIADARFTRSMANGADIDAPEVRSARQQEIQARLAAVKALQAEVDTLKNAGPLNLDAQQKLSDYTKQLEEAKTSLAVLSQQDRSMIAARQVQRLNVQSAVLGLRSEREAYGLAAGQVAPALTAQVTAQRAIIRKNEEIAGNARMKPEERDAARVAAEEARNRILALERAGDYQRTGIPRLLTGGYTSRTLALAGSRLEQGAGLSELSPLLSEGVRGSQRALEQARKELAFRQGHRDRYGVEDIEESRNGVFDSEQRLRTATRLQAYTPYALAGSEFSRRGMILEGRVTARRSLMLGPEANREDVLSTVRLMDERRRSLLGEAGEADRQKDTERAKDLRAQAETLRYQIPAAFVSGMSDYSMSARSRLSLGQNDLQLGLAQQNPMMPVPPSLYRQRIGLLNTEIGRMQSYMSGMPDAVKANLMPQLSSLMLSKGEAQNSLHMGSIGQMFSVMFGAPNGMSMSMGMESLAPGQAFSRRTGTPLPDYLGGSYTGYGQTEGIPALTPSDPTLGPGPMPPAGSGMGPGSGSGLGGGEIRELTAAIKALPDQIAAAIQRGGPTVISPASAVGPNFRTQQANDPREVQRKRLNGEVP